MTEIIYTTKLKSHDIFWADDIRRYYIILALFSMWRNNAKCNKLIVPNQKCLKFLIGFREAEMEKK